MLINEIATPNSGIDPNKLLGLVQFLAGRANDTDAQKQISQDAFIKLAQNLRINVTSQNLAELVGLPPLNGVLEPLDQQSGMITFKGADIGPSNMSVPQAQQVVDKMAKSAMKRPM
jgi:hypothetical protein